MKFETLAIHAGQERDEATGATIVPVYQTATFTQDAIGADRGFAYSRSGNPTRAALEKCLASLEGAGFALAYASGMAAIAGTMQLLRSGDHVVVADDLYGGAHRLFSKVLPNQGLRFTYVDATQPAAVAKALEPATRMVWIESPTNPMLRLIDVAACAEIARRHGAWLVVDNTFATPFLQNPVALGAHVVVHSTTKYLGGHSDVIGGAVARKQMRGYGGMVTIELAGGGAAARKLCESRRVFSLAESLGGVESLIGYPYLMSHAAFSPEEKRAKGISEAVVRLSVGLEDADDLCDDLLQALAQCR
jgi:cystathionine beta-lyase/cystathionine gamma-synthase